MIPSLLAATFFLTSEVQKTEPPPSVPPRYAQAYRYVNESPWTWYRVAMPLRGPVVWDRKDTLEVVSEGRTLRAKEQVAITPPHEWRMVRLQGVLPVRDLHQLDWKGAPALMLWIGLELPVRLKDARVRIAERAPGAAAPAPTIPGGTQ